MQSKFNVGDVVFFYPDTDKNLIECKGGRIVQNGLCNFLNNVYGGNVKEIIISGDSVAYHVQCYDLYGNPDSMYKVRQDCLFDTKMKCKDFMVQTLREDIGGIQEILDAVEQRGY